MAHLQRGMPSWYSTNFRNTPQFTSDLLSAFHHDAQNFGAWIKPNDVRLDIHNVIVDEENSYRKKGPKDFTKMAPLFQKQ